MLKPKKCWIWGTKYWYLFERLDFKIDAEELYIVPWTDIADRYLKETIETFQKVCPEHTERCYIALAKNELGWFGYVIFPHFEDAHRLHGIVMLLGELKDWCELGSDPYIAYLNAHAEVLVIKIPDPVVDFVVAVLRSPYRRFR